MKPEVILRFVFYGFCQNNISPTNIITFLFTVGKSPNWWRRFQPARRHPTPRSWEHFSSTITSLDLVIVLFPAMSVVKGPENKLHLSLSLSLSLSRASSPSLWLSVGQISIGSLANLMKKMPSVRKQLAQVCKTWHLTSQACVCVCVCVCVRERVWVWARAWQVMRNVIWWFSHSSFFYLVFFPPPCFFSSSLCHLYWITENSPRELGWRLYEPLGEWENRKAVPGWAGELSFLLSFPSILLLLLPSILLFLLPSISSLFLTVGFASKPVLIQFPSNTTATVRLINSPNSSQGPKEQI